eukprot:TRINITY_DN92112_c0_g1_i1.p1 TRINITY_DN92112_c0_g1~~TRINITY_DN92112_c0_g1_i1.p1  ORF type:complete len:558 (+),score=121.98 TRINITY_DN92112_c0_g1_i1:133-1806(+)
MAQAADSIDDHITTATTSPNKSYKAQVESRTAAPFRRLRADGQEVDVEAFDDYDTAAGCRELINRLQLVSQSGGTCSQWKWDIIDFLAESKQQLNASRQTHSRRDVGEWRELREAVDDAATSGTLPTALRTQCEEFVSKREAWLGDFDAELRALLQRSAELRERLLFEDTDRAGWFSNSGVTGLEVQRLMERHLEMHQRLARFARQLRLLCRSLRQQGAVSSRRKAFQAKSTTEKVQSSLLCLAAVAVAPVPGAGEMWLATTTMMWLDKDQAAQHVVYEHPRDADTENILSQFHSRTSKARQTMASWLALPSHKRRNEVLIHNAGVRRVIVTTHLVNSIDGSGERQADWTSALDSHPLALVMKKAAISFTGKKSDDENNVVIGPQRVAIVQLPTRPDTNWGWRGVFSYSQGKIGECRLKEGGTFSFICVDSGLNVRDKEVEADESASREEATVEAAASEGDATIEVENRTDDPMAVKIFEASQGLSNPANLFRSPLQTGIIGPEASKIFHLPPKLSDGSKAATEAEFDVEIRIGNRTAKCEVMGGQIISVDGIMADS